ncbi:MAG: class II aldolase/adducin family protein [Candidatus Protistobacter heckmanni]|nr:class II aldolase/adducin family protein [Candidatus Protistobacter heckmanni]
MPSAESQLREEVCRIGRRLYDRGLAHATAGNISARLEDGFLITPTDAYLGELDPAQLVKTDAQGGAQAAGPRPSKTLALHRRIYAVDAEAGAVIHTHSTHLVALTLERTVSMPQALIHAAAAMSLAPLPDLEHVPASFPDLLPPITPYFVMKVGHVPLLPYHQPGDPRVADLVGALIAERRERGAPIRALMLDRLGPNVWAATPAQACAVLEELEETAKLWRWSDPKPAPLDEAQIEELREAFGARW